MENVNAGAWLWLFGFIAFYAFVLIIVPCFILMALTSPASRGAVIGVYCLCLLLLIMVRATLGLLPIWVLLCGVFLCGVVSWMAGTLFDRLDNHNRYSFEEEKKQNSPNEVTLEDRAIGGCAGCLLGSVGGPLLFIVPLNLLTRRVPDHEVQHIYIFLWIMSLPLGGLIGLAIGAVMLSKWNARRQKKE